MVQGGTGDVRNKIRMDVFLVIMIRKEFPWHAFNIHSAIKAIESNQGKLYIHSGIKVKSIESTQGKL